MLAAASTETCLHHGRPRYDVPVPLTVELLITYQVASFDERPVRRISIHVVQQTIAVRTRRGDSAVADADDVRVCDPDTARLAEDLRSARKIMNAMRFAKNARSLPRRRCTSSSRSGYADISAAAQGRTCGARTSRSLREACPGTR
jgi:hypothetical protein